MTQSLEDSELLRQFLLGELDEERRERVEERLLTEKELHDELSATRDELIDEYVFGVMGAHESKLFESNFDFTPERLHELRLSKALRKHAEANADRKVPSPVPSIPRRYFFLDKKMLMAAAAIIVIVVGYGLWSIYRNERLQVQMAQLRNERLRVEQDLARLNQRPLPERLDSPLSVINLTLESGIERDPGKDRRALVGSEQDFLQLSLRLAEDKFRFYRAVIQTDDGADIYNIDNLTASAHGQGKFVKLILPSRLLPTGDYQVKLVGDAGESRHDAVGTYSFQIVLK